MPYIKQARREELDNNVYNDPNNAGELNYLFTQIAKYYWVRKQNYQAINDIVGALEGAKAEFQRRVVSQYEDIKKLENGDVYQ